MVNESTLDHLLHVESEAATLIADAQKEADKRIRKSEEENHAQYEKRFQQEITMQETALKNETDNIKRQYQEKLSQYKEQISAININIEKFCSLFNEYLGIAK